MKISKKAEMGIGTLILFIAMILVAAVAAGVLIQTASSLQARALLTGSETTSEVSTALMITNVYGQSANATQNTLNRTYMKMQLAPGSDPIRFQDVVVNLDTPNERLSLTFNNSIDCSARNVTEIVGSTGILNATHASSFGVDFLVGPKFSRGYMYRGDVVEICMRTPEAITEGMSFRISVVPRTGTQAVVSLRAPNVLVTDRVHLYP